MNVIVVLLSLSLLAAIGFLVAFLRALKRGQFDDLVTPPIRMLFDTESEGNDNSRDRGES